MKKTKKDILKKACGKGGPGLSISHGIEKTQKIGNAVSKGITGLKNLGWDAMDKVERGKLAPNEIPMRYQPDIIKKAHLKNFPKVIGKKIVNAHINPVGAIKTGAKWIGGQIKKDNESRAYSGEQMRKAKELEEEKKKILEESLKKQYKAPAVPPVKKYKIPPAEKVDSSKVGK